MWSVFQNPLISALNSTASAISLAYSLVLAIMAITSIFAGKLQDKYGPRYVMIAGSILWGLGWLLTGFSQSVVQVYLTFGIMAGIGCGCVYNCCISNTVKWFPDKSGFASGLIVSAAGMGPIVFSPLAYYVMSQSGVFMSFKILGGGFLVIMLLMSWFIVAPTTGWNLLKPSAASSDYAGKGNNKNLSGMLSDPLFYILWLILMFGATSGLMIIGHVAAMGQELAKLSGAVAAMTVSILAVANTSGRIFWGYLSDRAGRYSSLMVIFVITALSIVVLGQTSSFYPFIIVVCLIGLCFGGIFAIFPSVCADLFGFKNLGQNYGVLFTAYAGGAIIGPRLAAKCKEIYGNYTTAFVVAAVLAVIAMVLLALIMQQRRKRSFSTPSTQKG